MPLNEQQQAAATAAHALPVKVVAGAGTGKTETLAARFVELVRNGVPPSRILLLTFTEDAAAEMRERVRQRLTEAQLDLPAHELIDLWCHTFHGFAMRLIRQWGWMVNLPPTPGSLDESDRRLLLEEIVAAWEDTSERNEYRPLEHNSYRWEDGEAWKKALAVLDQLRANGAPPHDLGPHPHLREQQNKLFAAERAQIEPLIKHIFEAYCDNLQRAGQLDYDEQIAAARRLLTAYPALGRQFAAVMVDEFQDTNPAQLDLLALIRPDWTAVTIVGDPRQAIYGWRSARPDSLRLFPYRPTQPHVSQPLQHNQRSRPAICTIANLALLGTELAGEEPLIAGREVTGLHPALVDAPEVSLHVLPGVEDGAQFIAAEIARLIRAGVRPREIAVLMRARTHLATFLAALEAAGVPYTTGGGSGFFRQPSVRLVASLLQLLVDPDDDLAATHVLESPLVGLDLRLLRRPSEGYRPAEMPSPSAWLTDPGVLPDDLPNRQALLERLNAFRAFCRLARARAFLLAPSDFLVWLFSASGLRAWAHNTQDRQALRNFDKLVALAVAWRKSHTGLTVTAYADRLQRSVREPPDEPVPPAPALDAVEVTTIHGAKGREWPVVCVVDTQLPSLRSGQVEHVLWDEEWKLVIADGRSNARAGAPDPLADLRRDLRRRARNEERSIWYVGLTRARDRLIVTHSGCELDGQGHFEDARVLEVQANEHVGDVAVHFFHELWENVR